MQINNMQKKEALKWLCDNYFVAIYDENDEYCTSFEDIIETSNFLNIPIKEVLRKCRQENFIKFRDLYIKLYLIKKQKNIESVKMR